jgi:hypothetical protein
MLNAHLLASFREDVCQTSMLPKILTWTTRSTLSVDVELALDVAQDAHLRNTVNSALSM